MKKYRFLLFDLDGTLMDFHQCEVQAITESLKLHGVPFSKELPMIYSEINDSFWKRFERGEITKDQILSGRFEKFFQVIGENVSQGGRIGNVDIVAFAKTYQERLSQQAFYIDGAVELMEYLSPRYYLCIVTNGVSATQYSRLKRNDFGRFFQHIFVSEDTGYQKPMKEYFDYCFANIPGFRREEALIIGDSLTSDIKGGNGAGIDTCWFHPEGFEKTGDVQATYEIRSLRELCPIIEPNLDQSE